MDKLCKKCGETDPSEFYTHRTAACKKCELARNAKWFADRKGARANYELKKKYGFGIETYESLLAVLGGVCAICGGQSTKGRLHVDHNHKTGLIRGLLCRHCNAMLGFARDNSSILESATKYLKGEHWKM